MVRGQWVRLDFRGRAELAQPNEDIKVTGYS
jgi:hypothetical protein